MSNVRPGRLFFRPLESLDASSVVVWRRGRDLLRVAFKCYSCGGTGIKNMKLELRVAKSCPKCGGSGWFGLNGKPTTGMPGSDAKLIVLQHRYANNMPLWNDGDAEDTTIGMKWGEVPKPMRQKGKGEKSAAYKIRKKCIKLRSKAGLKEAEKFMKWAMDRVSPNLPVEQGPLAAEQSPARESGERVPL